MKILKRTFSDSDICLLDLDARNIESAFAKTLTHLVDRKLISASARDEVSAGLLERERTGSTAIGNAVAVPHCYTDSLIEPLVVFVRLEDSLNLGAPDGIATRYLFILLGPTDATSGHLDTLAHIARLMSDDEFRYEIGEARDTRSLQLALEHSLARSAPREQPKPSLSEGLAYTGRFCGGLIQDLKRRLPHYASDFRDGLHFKSLSSTLFLLFACLAPAITFGGIMAELTGNQIGAVEMLMGSAFCGIAFATLSGQPLIILGGTGPLLVFTWILYGLCNDYGVAFLPARAWVGLWTTLFLLVLAATDASCLMRFFTRFTDEIFAALISLIFIYAAVEALAEICIDVYREEQTSHDKALVPLILAIGTFYIAMSLSRFRRSRYLLPKIREFLADFGPSIALGSMLAVAFLWFHDVELKTLPAPKSFRPTLDRSWLVNLFDVPTWVWFAAIGPAILVTVLVFVDQNITARIVNSHDHKLTKGEAYHYDLALMAVLIGICSLFGLPWLVAATVRSLNHVRSLATLEEVTSQGETRERVIHVRETRLTGLAIHLLIGFSLLLLPLLKGIPMSILYGLFLFMGVVSMAGNQFFERLGLWVMDTTLYPVTHYTRRVPAWTIHSFTLIQFICLAVLLAVEVSPIGILFPLFIALLVPVRFYVGRFFRREHLLALDAEEIPEDEETQWS